MKITLFVPAILLISALSLDAAEPKLAPPQMDKLLMLDSRVIAEAENAILVPGTPEKAPENPLLPSDQPWEKLLPERHLG